MNEELITAKKVTHLLDQAADDLPPHIRARLNASISKACEAHQNSLNDEHRNRGNLLGHFASWLGGPRAAVAFSCAMFAVVTLGISNELDDVKFSKAAEVAELDAAILMDDLPTEAYLDSNFVGFSVNEPSPTNADDGLEQWLEQFNNQSS